MLGQLVGIPIILFFNFLATKASHYYWTKKNIYLYKFTMEEDNKSIILLL